MNVLILTGKFGFGHTSAANSIKEKILLENPDYNVQIIDFIEYLFPLISKVIYGTFNFLVNKCCMLYNFLNKIGSKNSNAPLKSFFVEKIDRLLLENKIDMVISVFPVCSQYISAYKKMRNSNVILNTCVTDVDVHEEWISDETNLYFVACEKTKNNLIDKGVTENKIIISGIPVKQNFKFEKEVKNKHNILIMGGGLGLIPSIDEFLSDLDETENFTINVIVGNNQKMYDKLSNKYKNINVIGFTNEVYKYMREADLIVTKAGGVTMFEAIVSETPIFVIKPFLKQELGNALYIEDNKIGEVVWEKNSSISASIINLINDNNKRLEMISNMKKIKESFEDISFTTFSKGGEL